MTIVGNLQTLKAHLDAHEGPLHNKAKWHEWIDDAIVHIGPEGDAPSTAEKLVMEAHEKSMADLRARLAKLHEDGDEKGAAELLEQYPELAEKPAEGAKASA